MNKGLPPASDTEVTLPASVPLFPLPNHVLLPDLPVPYRVFEPRYKQLIDDLLREPDNERWFAVPRLPPGTETGERPAFTRVATLALLMQVSILPEEHYFVIARGMHRVRLREIESDRMYRLAEPSLWPDIEEAPGAALGGRYDTVRQLLNSLAPHLGDAADEVRLAFRSAPDMSTGVYRLGSICLPDADRRQALLEARTLVQRLEMIEDALASALAMTASEGDVS